VVARDLPDPATRVFEIARIGHSLDATRTRLDRIPEAVPVQLHQAGELCIQVIETTIERAPISGHFVSPVPQPRHHILRSFREAQPIRFLRVTSNMRTLSFRADDRQAAIHPARENISISALSNKARFGSKCLQPGPVKLPRSCPKRCPPTGSAGIAPQLTATKGPSRRLMS
jgi:hypothetical protein